MKVVIHAPTPRELRSNVRAGPALQAIRYRLENTPGVDLRVVEQPRYVPCDLAVMWGIYSIRHHAKTRGRRTILSGQEARGAKTLVIERGWLDRENYDSYGLGGLNNRADFSFHQHDPCRLMKLHTIQQVSRVADAERVILVIGQVPWDTSCQHVNFQGWVDDTIAEIRQYTGRPVVFRPHPLGQSKLFATGVEISELSLEEDLERAHTAVTFNSTLGVDALRQGIPVYAADKGSMVLPGGYDDLSLVEDPPANQTSVLSDIACYQWTLGEVQNGTMALPLP